MNTNTIRSMSRWIDDVVILLMWIAVGMNILRSDYQAAICWNLAILAYKFKFQG